MGEIAPAGLALPDPENNRGPCSCTGLAVVSVGGASVAHSTFAGAHAGRRKVIIAGGGEVTHHSSMLGPDGEPVNPPPALPRVAFQGALGAFSELAIQQQWQHHATPVPCDTFDEALDRVIARDADFAVIPVENAIAGRVDRAVAALQRAGDRVQRFGEVRTRIHLCLMAPPGATLDTLRLVQSHPVALSQCRIFFARHGWLTPEPHADTAGAARDVASLGDCTIGAVASNAAAERYGLQILAHSIEDVPANWTRFVIVSGY